ncbi:MAG: alpha/beta hydrolase [bacterium]|nr:alpha/beta hydrolase [bacterium]
MKRGVLITIAIIVLVYLAICVAMFLLQRSLLYFPQPRRVRAPESTMVLPVDGAELVVTVRPLDGAKAIIYFGGNGEDVSQNLDVFSRAFPDHALFLLHYRGYGGSTGKPTEQAIHGDAAALYEKVRSRHPDVAVIGRSLGSGVAVRLASRYPVARLILVTPYDSILGVATAAYPLVPVRLLLRDRYESGKYAPDIETPTTIIAAEYDEVIPRASTEKLLSRFRNGMATMQVIGGVGHNDLGANGEYLEAVQGALR